jgi:hypothetical protein
MKQIGTIEDTPSIHPAKKTVDLEFGGVAKTHILRHFIRITHRFFGRINGCHCRPYDPKGTTKE